MAKIKQALGRLIRRTGKGRRRSQRGMYKYNRKRNSRLAVIFGYWREIDKSNDIGSRRPGPTEASGTQNAIGSMMFLRVSGMRRV